MSPSQPVFSRSIAVDALPPDGRQVSIEASAAERTALAALDGLPGIAALSAELTLRPRAAGTVHVTGRVRAHVTQTCTVSLDPFDVSIDEPVDVTFMPEKGVAAWLSKHKVDKDEPGLADEDPPDTIVDGHIDAGQIAAEFLSLALDPYPRKPGVAFDAEAYAPEKDESPFAALARLRTPEG